MKIKLFHTTYCFNESRYWKQKQFHVKIKPCNLKIKPCSLKIKPFNMNFFNKSRYWKRNILSQCTEYYAPTFDFSYAFWSKFILQCKKTFANVFTGTMWPLPVWCWGFLVWLKYLDEAGNQAQSIPDILQEKYNNILWTNGYVSVVFQQTSWDELFCAGIFETCVSLTIVRDIVVDIVVYEDGSFVCPASRHVADCVATASQDE